MHICQILAITEFLAIAGRQLAMPGKAMLSCFVERNSPAVMTRSVIGCVIGEGFDNVFEENCSRPRTTTRSNSPRSQCRSLLVHKLRLGNVYPRSSALLNHRAIYPVLGWLVRAPERPAHTCHSHWLRPRSPMCVTPIVGGPLRFASRTSRSLSDQRPSKPGF